MTEVLYNPDKTRWDAFVCSRQEATFCHHTEWAKSLAAAYQLRIFRLATESCATARELSGILPLVLFSPPGRQKRLISLPYSDAAGIVAADSHAAHQLLVAALKLADELGADHLELRQAGNSLVRDVLKQRVDSWDHATHTFKTGLQCPLPESSEVLWHTLSAKVRNQVRKAKKCGGSVAVGGAELFDDFYAVFSENMRDLGSPVHDPACIRNILGQKTLPSRVVIVRIADTIAAAAILFIHNRTVYNPWASSLRKLRPLCPNMLLYWSMLKCGIANGCRWFDFGRSSPGASTCRFKLQWGATMQPLEWHVFSRNPSRWYPEMETLVDEEWKTLDLETSRRLGPAVRKWISL